MSNEDKNVPEGFTIKYTDTSYSIPFIKHVLGHSIHIHKKQDVQKLSQWWHDSHTYSLIKDKYNMYPGNEIMHAIFW